jgi:hypothetical protein
MSYSFHRWTNFSNFTALVPPLNVRRLTFSTGRGSTGVSYFDDVTAFAHCPPTTTFPQFSVPASAPLYSYLSLLSISLILFFLK